MIKETIRIDNIKLKDSVTNINKEGGLQPDNNV